MPYRGLRGRSYAAVSRIQEHCALSGRCPRPPIFERAERGSGTRPSIGEKTFGRGTTRPPNRAADANDGRG
eukprot:6373623-Pyramimonas_sp.AAC.1